jgi:hypothetical protein
MAIAQIAYTPKATYIAVSGDVVCSLLSPTSSRKAGRGPDAEVLTDDEAAAQKARLLGS